MLTMAGATNHRRDLSGKRSVDRWCRGSPAPAQSKLCRPKSTMAEPSIPIVRSRSRNSHSQAGRLCWGWSTYRGDTNVPVGHSVPGVATCSTTSSAAGIDAKSLAGPIAAALVGVPSRGTSSRRNVQHLQPLAEGTRTTRQRALRRTAAATLPNACDRRSVGSGSPGGRKEP
jgi:hypothetical protein